jgi:hypothetical protein
LLIRLAGFAGRGVIANIDVVIAHDGDPCAGEQVLLVNRSTLTNRIKRASFPKSCTLRTVSSAHRFGFRIVHREMVGCAISQ